MTPVRVLIVDDERLARVGLRRQLARFDELAVVGECSDGASAVDAIRSLAPDLVFLDVRMPERDGFQVIEAVGPARMPAVVFLTAYEEHAIRAFEADAVDYLVKPVDPVRLEAAVGRALRRLTPGRPDDLPDRLASLLRTLARAPATVERIPVEEQGRYHLVDPAEVTWVEAAGNYVRLHTSRRLYRLRSTLDDLDRRLQGFVRVSRSALVNRQMIDTIEPFLKGSYVLALKGGAKVRSGRAFRAAVAELLERGG